MVFGTFSFNNQIKFTALIWALHVLVVKYWGYAEDRRGINVSNVSEVCNVNLRKGINLLKSKMFANGRTRFCKCSLSHSVSKVIQAADVRKILDLHRRFHMITEQCSSFCAFSDQLEKPYQFCF